ncbi:MAG: Zn-ribbon domain-containing OB-fold protein [Candidatus Bathyarchaeia archaeon]|jgi:hypothetical protein
MSLEKFGTVSYTKESRVNDFVKHLEEGKVMATKCKECGRISFPPRADCVDCMSKDFEWKELKRKGKLLTYTIAQFAPTGFENEAPYVLALVELEEGLHMLAHMSKNVKPEEIKIGMDLKVVPVKRPDGRVTITFEKA